MSITLATKGRLWPRSTVIREQFTEISVAVIDPIEVATVVEEDVDIATAIEDGDVASSVELIDTVTGLVIEPDDISGNTKGCS